MEVGKEREDIELTLEEAKFALDRKLIELAAENGEVPALSDIRFFLYPDRNRRLVLAGAERADGGEDIEFLFELATPVAGGHLDENAVRTMFLDVPSGLRH
jgi:hypothetical protein